MKKKACLYLIFALILSFYGLSCKRKDINTTKKMETKSSRDVLVSKAFPELKAQTLARQNVVFPKDGLGKPTILCLVFDRPAQALVDTWTTPILAKYPDNTVNYYEIPMIKGAWGIMSGFIDNGMRGGVPKELHNNVATYYGSLSDYKRDLMLEDKSSCYIFLLDKTGVIQYVAESSADAEKLTALYAAIDKINQL
jgi:ATP10 protein